MYSNRLSQAFDLAARAHATQTRKGGAKPYLGHLCVVAGTVLEAGGSEEQVCAALLHDVLEDQGDKVSYGDLERDFGAHVATLVRALSDVEIAEPDGDKGPWWPRKRAYLAALATHGPEVLLISSADKLHNARTLVEEYSELGEGLWPRFSGGRAGTLWYQREIIGVLETAWPENPLLPSLKRVVSRLLTLTGEPPLGVAVPPPPEAIAPSM